MCSPKIAQVVQKRIAREGRPAVSRRNFLKMGGLMAAGLTVGVSAAPAWARPARQMGQVVDLSHSLSVDFPVFPAFQQAVKETLVTVEENGFYAQQWTFGEHTSTHMDAPGHFIGDGQLVDQLDVEMLVGPAAVIDITAKAAENPDAFLDMDDIMAWEEEFGEIPAGAFVMMYSGWEEKLGTDEYSGTDEDGVLHFPGFSPEAAEFLISERDIKGVGVDTLSIDNGTSATFDVHYTVLGAGALGIENLANLAAIKDTVATVVLGIPKYEAGSGGPLRVLAMM